MPPPTVKEMGRRARGKSRTARRRRGCRRSGWRPCRPSRQPENPRRAGERVSVDREWGTIRRAIVVARDISESESRDSESSRGRVRSDTTPRDANVRRDAAGDETTHLVGGRGEETTAGRPRARRGAERRRAEQRRTWPRVWRTGGAGERAGGARQDGVHGCRGDASAVGYGRSRGSGVDDGAKRCAERHADTARKSVQSCETYPKSRRCSSHATVRWCSVSLVVTHV